MPFIPHTASERRRMLDTIGVKSIDDLFAAIPQDLRPKSFSLPAGLGEMEVKARIERLAGLNRTDLTCFVGGGFYDHYVPSAVPALTARGEFFTAYTPYQPEASQGTLQAIYEYQSAICRLTGMEVTNASMYDGGTAMYEAAMMAVRCTGRDKIVVDSSVSPIYRVMMESYMRNLNVELVVTEHADGLANRAALTAAIDDRTAGVILQNPNFFGCVEDFSEIAKLAHDKKALLIMSVYPMSLALLKTPGEMGADIATGEGQSFGLGLNFGGPYLGLMSCLKKHVRKMPGRIVGETVDSDGRRGFVLTLQAREQHIRREKATSNICSNEGLCALQSLVYMSLVGREGLKSIAATCAERAGMLREKLLAIDGIRPKFDHPFFNEFVIEFEESAAVVVSKLIRRGVIAGFPLGRYYPELENSLLVAVTEKRTSEEIGIFAEQMKGALA